MTPDILTTSTITESHIEMLAAGGTIVGAHGNAAMALVGDRYVMAKRDGNTKQTHTLDAASTDAARLNAHWQHFAA